EERLAAFFGLGRAAAVGSGTDALVLALRALGLEPGHKVAVTSLSFVASASAIVLAGGVPVFVDPTPGHLLAREDMILDLVRSGRVDGVVAVHLYGQMAELEEIYGQARKRGLFVIEDAAQALGATRNGYAPGRFSDATCLSFDPTKVIGAQGSGGMVLSNDQKLIETVKRLRYHGHAGNRVYTEIGHNSQLATVQAALIKVKMDHEQAWRERRQQIAARYDQALNDLAFASALPVRPGNTHIRHKYVIDVPQGRDDLAAHLKAQGVGVSVHYSMPLFEQPCLRGRCEVYGDASEVKRAVSRVLSLPIYPELTDLEVDAVCRALAEFEA
ncbi:MAG: DegT/DnrJ/EryC1/StrS family aminotransferase, partial [Desulfovibrionaceae bacterium]|nr:DegT/DnrJ/EryC1/StrS family aminotransferase [Desulfovibrionaceae bacterium]